MKTAQIKAAHWKFYKNFYKGYSKPLFLAIWLTVMQSLIVLPIALLIKSVFDRAIPEKAPSHLLLLCILILGLYLMGGGLTLLTRNISLKTTKKVVRDIRNAIFSKIYAFPRSFYQKTDRLKLHASIVQDTLRVDIMSNALVAQLIPSLLVSSGLCVILISLSWRLFLIMLTITPLIFIFNRIFGKRIKTKIRTYHDFFEVFSKRIMVLLDILDLTKIHSAERMEQDKQAEIHDRLRTISGSQAWFNAAYRITLKTIVLSFGIVILLFGSGYVIKGELTIGELIATFAAMGLMRNHLLIIINVIPQILEGSESLGRLYSLFHTDTQAPYNGKKRISFGGLIQFKSVYFSYDRKPVLKDVSFVLNPGETTCILGPNGAGKTTIAHLLLGLYRPQQGYILGDGIRFEELDIAHLRRQTGVVQQNPMIFPGTILENLTYGRSESSSRDLEKALELSLCTGFLEKLPNGLHTKISRRDIQLSAGELQKLAIARALLGAPVLLVFDEPSNHLDTDSRQKIMANLKTMKPKPSIFLISHNPNLAWEADRIFILKEGNIVRTLTKEEIRQQLDKENIFDFDHS